MLLKAARTTRLRSRPKRPLFVTGLSALSGTRHTIGTLQIGNMTICRWSGNQPTDRPQVRLASPSLTIRGKVADDSQKERSLTQIHNPRSKNVLAECQVR